MSIRFPLGVVSRYKGYAERPPARGARRQPPRIFFCFLYVHVNMWNMCVFPAHPALWLEYDPELEETSTLLRSWLFSFSKKNDLKDVAIPARWCKKKVPGTWCAFYNFEAYFLVGLFVQRNWRNALSSCTKPKRPQKIWEDQNHFSSAIKQVNKNKTTGYARTTKKKSRAPNCNPQVARSDF